MLNRHPTDVIRTVAHELVHRAQHQHQPLSSSDGVTGSDVENQANSVAGILMRMWSMNNL
jgi:Zn-dependent peptidase ImmA (M78 family)